ncbi:STAS domain-containing protein [Amycolatopsis sp.]|uniref:STAS domain-containing protein n=1 Tax=Amycolatopsis sp. TaxID=37632 RepID=UPI002C0D92C1|nr:STAS domain-containing protein [Amycolatopsis sp.]HVV08519.1 STAS domain-containing protein [Amycolatopsis sp.]
MTEARIESGLHGDAVRIAVSGEIDLANATEVQGEINAAIGNEATTVMLDLSKLDYLDSAGLRVVFTLASRLRVLQMTLELYVPPDARVRRVVELSGLEPVVRLRSSLD